MALDFPSLKTQKSHVLVNPRNLLDKASIASFSSQSDISLTKKHTEEAVLKERQTLPPISKTSLPSILDDKESLRRKINPLFDVNTRIVQKALNNLRRLDMDRDGALPENIVLSTLETYLICFDDIQWDFISQKYQDVSDPTYLKYENLMKDINMVILRTPDNTLTQYVANGNDLLTKRARAKLAVELEQTLSANSVSQINRLRQSIYRLDSDKSQRLPSSEVQHAVSVSQMNINPDLLQRLCDNCQQGNGIVDTEAFLSLFDMAMMRIDPSATMRVSRKWKSNEEVSRPKTVRAVKMAPMLYLQPSSLPKQKGYSADQLETLSGKKREGFDLLTSALYSLDIEGNGVVHILEAMPLIRMYNSVYELGITKDILDSSIQQVTSGSGYTDIDGLITLLHQKTIKFLFQDYES